MKTLKKILIVSVIIIIGFPLLIYMIVYYAFWEGEHTYYHMYDCTLQQSREIFELTELKLYEGITISHLKYHDTDGEHTHRYFYFELSGDEEDLSEYLTYLEQNSSKEFKNKYDSYSYKVYVYPLDETDKTLSFSYTLYGHYSWDLPVYIRQHGTRKVEF